MEEDGAPAHCSYQESPCATLESPSDASDEADGEACPICLDSWSNDGEHRLVALKCGHLFGAICIERWLKGQTLIERSCPTCKSKAALKDLRCIYARRLVVADTAQVTTLREQVEQLSSEKRRLELALKNSRAAQRSSGTRKLVIRSPFSSTMRPVSNERPTTSTCKFALAKNLEIGKDSGCRVLTYNAGTNELYVAHKSGNGYGIRRVTCADYRLRQFLFLHHKPIRDIAYSQRRDLLLSVGLDGAAKIVERGFTVATIQSKMPLWSCSWDHLRNNEFYVGGAGGVVHQYDVRNPMKYIQRLADPVDMSPVVSVCSTEFGLLSCQLNSCWLWREAMWRQWQPKALPLDGSFMCLKYDRQSQRALVAGRPRSDGAEKSIFKVCKLVNSILSPEVLFEADQSFTSSTKTTIMSKSCWVHALDASWIAAHSESDSVLYLHGLDGSETMLLPATDPALDVCSWQTNTKTVIAALSATGLRLYNTISTDL